MFLRNIKDLNKYKNDVIYIWNENDKFCFLIYEKQHNDWTISYMIKDRMIMSVIIDKKGTILYGNGPLYEKMKEENLTVKEIFVNFMSVLEHHFDHLDHYTEKKEEIFD